MAKKVERTTPGSKLDWRITYDSGNKKWTNDKPGDGKGDPGERKDVFDDLTVRRAINRVERAVRSYAGGKDGKKAIQKAVEDFEQHAGVDSARTAVRALYKSVKGSGGKIEEGMGIAKDHLNRNRDDMKRKSRIMDRLVITERMANDFSEFDFSFMAHEIEAGEKPNIHAMYRKFNRAYFDGELPENLPIKWFKSKNAAGVCRGMWNPSGGSKAIQIRISEYVANDTDVVEGVMLHEMCHAYCFEKQIDKGHGAGFNSVRRRIGNKAGVVIPLKEALDHFVVPENIKTRTMGVIVVEREGKKKISTYNYKFFKSSFHRIIDMLQQIADRHGHRNQKFIATLFEAKSRDLQIYPEQRSIRSLAMYEADGGLIHEIMSNGLKVGRITPDESLMSS